MNPSEAIIARARQMGLDLAGVVPARRLDISRYQDWLTHGYHGEMAYLARADAVARRADPALILPEVRSIIVVAINYHTQPLPPELRDDPSRGIVASYAWGDDYHDVLEPRLRALATFIQAEHNAPVAWRTYIDTGPVLERELAAQAALGFIGKNTTLISPRLGSWLLLGEILVSVELPAAWAANHHPEPEAGTCGRCIRCLAACPTNALVAPYVLDARRCISYLTIELKGPIPRELRPLLGNRIFGCDICQEMCPWNRRFAQAGTEPAFRPRPDSMAPRLVDLIALNDQAFRGSQRFRRSPVRRAKRRGLLRNVAVALGNWGDPAAVPALAYALNDPEPLVRGHAAWALGRIPVPQAAAALDQALATESDTWVREEITIGLAGG